MDNRDFRKIQDELMSKLKSEETKSQAYLKGYGDAVSEILFLLDKFNKNKNCEN